MNIPCEVHHPGMLVVRVCGNRTYTDSYTEMELLDQIFDKAEPRLLTMVVVQGGRPGADAIARDWVRYRRGLHEAVELERIGRRPLRPDVCLAMPGGTDTAIVVERCRNDGCMVIHGA